MVEQGLTNLAGKTATAGTTGAAKVGLGKMMSFMPVLAVVGLAGIIAYEFWKGGKDADEMKKVAA